jgi:hypothetical protein
LQKGFFALYSQYLRDSDSEIYAELSQIYEAFQNSKGYLDMQGVHNLVKYLRPNAQVAIIKLVEGLSLKRNDYLDFEEFVVAGLFKKYYLN